MPHRPSTPEREAPLRVPREMAAEAGIVDRIGVRDRAQPRNERGLQRVEDLLDLDGLHAGLVVVEDDVVRVAVRLEARDVALAQLEVPLEVRQHDRVVLGLAGAEPALIAERAGAGDLGTEVGWHPDRLLVVAARDPDQACLERLEVVLLFERTQLLEELAELRRDVELVRDSVQRRPLLRADIGAARRHLRLLVPREDARRLLDVVDLGQSPPQLLEALRHAQEGTLSGDRPRPARPPAAHGGAESGARCCRV